MLTPQGKYFADFFLQAEQDSILLDVPLAREAAIIKKLNMYKLRSAATLTECPEYQVVAFLNEDNPNPSNNLIFIDPRSAKLGRRGFMLKSDLKQMTENLRYDKNAYDLTRIANFVAEGEKDLVSEQSFLLEYGLGELNAIDYKKGCYVGQELVARTHYLGVVRKQIVQVESEQELPALSTIIYAGEQKLGVICSSVNNKGLALIRTENVINLDPKMVITANEQEVKLRFKEKLDE
ncbi:MAG: hypothetical protein B7Z27_08685 [Sphingobacteriia bacterium 32-37-4]|nr:MAG: hypothetical protein B7Z27_08685 [Sphingobacteriia bacterium 32-37-4]